MSATDKALEYLRERSNFFPELEDAVDLVEDEITRLRAQLAASNDAVEGEFLSLHTKITELTVKLAASEEHRRNLERELFQAVMVLCETRNHEGNRPCAFCSSMHLHIFGASRRPAALAPAEGEG